MSFSETPEGRQAEQIHTNYAKALERIRSDKHLSSEGKKEQIAAEYNRAAGSLNAIKESFNSAKILRTHVLRRDLFGSTATDSQTAISFRDAQERVGAIDTQKKAIKLLDQAELSGDTVMVKALMQRAIESSWNQVVDSYGDRHPHYRAKVKELLALQTPSGIFSSRDTMEKGLILHLQKPEELGFW